MLRTLGVSKSAYYAWKNREPSARTQRSQRIRDAVLQVYDDSNQIYGSYKIAQELNKRPELESACRNTVAKAMQELGIKSKVSRRFKPTTTVTDASKKPAKNILN